MLPLQASVDQGAMVMKRYSTFPKTPALLEPNNRLFSVLSRTFIGRGLTSLWKCSWCILQPQLTGLNEVLFEMIVNFIIH